MFILNSWNNILPYHGEGFYHPDFFSTEESSNFFNNLLNTTEWKQLPIKIFGKEVMQPRLTAWFADSGKAYTYSGLSMTAFRWTKVLMEIRQKVEELSGESFNSALLNLYRNGNDSIGWHRDNEKELGAKPSVASVSFGMTRKFQLRDYATGKKLVSVDLSNGSLMLMRGETQRYWEHRIPKSKDKGKRINVTFRKIL